MNKEYATPLFWKILILILGLPSCGLFAWFAYSILINPPFNFIIALIISLILFGTIAMLVYGAIDSFLCKLIITKKEIILVRLKGTKKITFDEVKGIRSDKNYVYIIPEDENKKQSK